MRELRAVGPRYVEEFQHGGESVAATVSFRVTWYMLVFIQLAMPLLVCASGALAANHGAGMLLLGHMQWQS